MEKIVSLEKYGEFIKRWSEFYKYGFPIFVAVLATVFINIYTNNTNITIAEAFQPVFLLVFILYTLMAMFISVLLSGILYFIMVFIFGSMIFLTNKINYKLYKKIGLLLMLITGWIILVIGIFLAIIFKLKPWGLVGLFLILIGSAPTFFTIKNKIEKNNPIPSYIG